MREIRRYAKAYAKVEWRMEDGSSEGREEELQDLLNTLGSELNYLVGQTCEKRGSWGRHDTMIDCAEARRLTEQYIREAREDLWYERKRKHRRKSSQETA